MTIDPMTEAVEAAARAMYELLADYVGSSMPWDGQNPNTKDRFTEDAQAAISAALPILRAQFAEEVYNAIDEDRASRRDDWNYDRYELGMDTAAAIARDLGTK